MKKPFLLLAVAFLITSCSWNPLATPTPTQAPTPTAANLDAVKQQLQEKTGRTLPTQPAFPTTANAATTSASPNPTTTTTPRQEVLLSAQDPQFQATGIASRLIMGNSYELNILADLPALQTGQTYTAWIVKGQAGQQDYNLIRAGQLRNQKGGFLLDYKSSQDLTTHTQVIISRETNNDNTIETPVLTGAFN